jgi:hypothetical protein
MGMGTSYSLATELAREYDVLVGQAQGEAGGFKLAPEHGAHQAFMEDAHPA